MMNSNHLANFRAAQQYITVDSSGIAWRHGPWTHETEAEWKEVCAQIEAERLARVLDWPVMCYPDDVVVVISP